MSEHEVVRVDQEALAFYLFERDYLRFNPRPVEEERDESQRLKLLKTLRWLLTASAIALMLMSALNTFPEFAKNVPGWWAEQGGLAGPAAALIGGGAAVAGIELFIFVIAALLRVLPRNFKKSEQMLTIGISYVLALILGAFANQDFLIRPILEMPPEQRTVNLWLIVTLLAFGVGRFALMVAAGDSMALLYTLQDRMKSAVEAERDERTRLWLDEFRTRWDDRRPYWLSIARKRIDDGEIPAEALASGEVAQLNPTSSDKLSPHSLPSGSSVNTESLSLGSGE